VRAGRDLNRVEERRRIVDYDEVRRPTPEGARDAVMKARAFLEICAKEFGSREKTGGGDG
jgi:hypothetical protein